MIFDFNNNGLISKTSDDTGIDLNNGHLMARSGDNSVIDLNTGELHIVSSWDDNND